MLVAIFDAPTLQSLSCVDNRSDKVNDIQVVAASQKVVTVVLDVEDVVELDSDMLQTGKFSVRHLQEAFDYEGFRGLPLSERHMWPIGRCIVVRFRSLSDMLTKYPFLTAAALKGLTLHHAVSVSSRWVKPKVVGVLTDHECVPKCQERLVFVFRERAVARASCASSDVACQSDVPLYRLVHSTDVASWVSGGVSYITTQMLREQYRMVTNVRPVFNLSVPLSTMLTLYPPAALDVDALLAQHSVTAASTSTVHQRVRSLLQHSCSLTCTELLGFRRIHSGSLSSTSRSVENGTADRSLLFPLFVSESSKWAIIREWQERMSSSAQLRKPCSVCAQRFKRCDLEAVDSKTVDLRLLQNSLLPLHVLPNSYSLQAYDGAILHSGGLHTPWERGYIDLCPSCRRHLTVHHHMPADAIANFQYYGYERLPPEVRDAFEHASLFDVMLVARARASRVSYLLSDKEHFTGDARASQGFVKGNVVVLPQDTFQLRSVIPPGAEEVKQAMCALFISSQQTVTKEALKSYPPVLVNKSIVRILAHFLVDQNLWYWRDVTMNEWNIDRLYESGRSSDLHAAVEVACLRDVSDAENCSSYCARLGDEEENIAGHSASDPHNFLLESVGYTEGDHSPSNLRVMKASALAWCLDHKRFLQVRSGSNAVCEDHPGLLTWLFPHLDPFGIGGFFKPERQRSSQVSFARQVQNMLLQDGSRFERDPTFAFVCWNICQKREVNQSLSFRVGAEEQYRLGERLYKLAPALTDLMRIWQTDPHACPRTDLQREALSVLKRLQLVCRHLPGSSGYKQSRRNEITALVRMYGTPALFITINPADIWNPLVGILGDIAIPDWQAMSSFTRAVFVAQRPGVAAQFFDEVLSAFLEIVVMGTDNTGGLFGRCNAYYGMVEAQGRGTLHCHLLLWLTGNPNPQLLRDRMQRDESYRNQVIAWLEGHIKCELPDQQTVENNVRKPCVTETDIDPRLQVAPQLKEMNEEEFRLEFKLFVRRLAIACNWHEHTETCWKHLRCGEPRDDNHCRMCINGETRAFTEIDPETRSVLLCRLHPRINNFHDVVIFLVQCNMDIKYIGSGPAAKALVFYITDYITKSSLSVHVGLDALKYALRRNDEHEFSFVDSRAKEKSLFVKLVHALMSRHELSHQQVMSYMVGGGDVYKSHSFVTVPWASVDHYVAVTFGPEDHFDQHESAPVLSTITVSADAVHTSDIVADYMYRPTSESFNNMSFWSFCEMTEKITVHSEMEHLQKHAKHHVADLQDASCDGAHKRGCPAGERGRFLPGHPKSETLMLRMRSQRHAVVVAGQHFPLKRTTEDDYARWCRAMLVLFKPWRVASDLRAPSQSWVSTFENTPFPEYEKNVIDNFCVESECRDARDVLADSHNDPSSSTTRSEQSADHLYGEKGTGDMESLEVSVINAGLTDPIANFGGEDKNEHMNVSPSMASTDVSNVINMLERTDMFHYESHDVHPTLGKGFCAQTTDELRATVKDHTKLMQSLKKRRRPAFTEEESGQHQLSKRRTIHDASVTIGQLSSSNSPSVTDSSGSSDDLLTLQHVIYDTGIASNKDQMRALQIVGNHVITQSKDQLLLHIAGIGGSGKSHVIKSIQTLFDRLDARNKLRVTAPTGCAAVLIQGHTIHALTFLPKGRQSVKQPELEEIWKDVEYLIINEISLVSAKLLCDISRRLCCAKSSDSVAASKPFGGINVIFTGDFGQLKPVREHALFSHQLVSKLSPEVCNTEDGQSALHGAFLWRSITDVVELTENWRAKADPAFVNLLNRVRLGISWDGHAALTHAQRGSGVNYTEPDYDVLCKRWLQYLSTHEPESISRFVTAPVIVAEKIVRDAINDRKAKAFANAAGRDLHYYRAIDTLRKSPVTEVVRKVLWNLPSSKTEDSLGLLPLCLGLPVMVTENLAQQNNIVNGTQGIVERIVFDEDVSGARFPVCVYIHVEGSNVRAIPENSDLVPITPVRTPFRYVDTEGCTYNILRNQLPLVPAFAFTDYKVQGRSMDSVVVDVASSRSLQSVYVMLSRVKSLSSLAILRWFPSQKIYQRLSSEFHEELNRLRTLSLDTEWRYNNE